MFPTNQRSRLFSLRLGQTWPSWQKLFNDGAKALFPIKDGMVATLVTKTGQYRIIEEHDFQQIYGLAKDVERLRDGFRRVNAAVRAAQKHPDRENLEVLAQAVANLGELPELPTKAIFEPLMPENLEFAEDDDVILKPEDIERPLND